MVSNEEIFFENLFDIYPNPASENIRVRINGVNNLRNISFEIINAIGVIVAKKQSINSNEFVWPIEHLPNGLYFIEIKENNIRKGFKRLVISR